MTIAGGPFCKQAGREEKEGCVSYLEERGERERKHDVSVTAFIINVPEGGNSQTVLWHAV